MDLSRQLKTAIKPVTLLSVRIKHPMPVPMVRQNADFCRKNARKPTSMIFEHGTRCAHASN
ncbi:MAG: hypothetical protein Ct9H90mP16_21350 [Candidatus Poseidoniales archaeon]|nr:MAG: hypothetical protein Ct9H90mP16_21350 [Candidatus Poseidoniales archaeon]